MTLGNLSAILPVVLAALGLSFVVTGATIGRPIRALGWLVLHRIRLDALVRCPYCNAWWCALGIALTSGLDWYQALQCAFTTCVMAAIVQAQWSLAANEDFEQLSGSTPGQQEEPHDGEEKQG